MELSSTTGDVNYGIYVRLQLDDPGKVVFR
jgi:hypothetical protein